MLEQTCRFDSTVEQLPCTCQACDDDVGVVAVFAFASSKVLKRDIHSTIVILPIIVVAQNGIYTETSVLEMIFFYFLKKNRHLETEMDDVACVPVQV